MKGYQAGYMYAAGVADSSNCLWNAGKACITIYCKWRPVWFLHYLLDNISAKQKGLPVVALGCKIPTIKIPALQKYFYVQFPITNQPSDLPGALEATEDNLIRTAEALGNLLAMGDGK